MDNFDLKKFLGGKTLLKESAPGYDTRKQGEALPTIENITAAYEAKQNIKEEQFDARGYYGEVKIPAELFEKLEESLEEFQMSVQMSDGDGGIDDVPEASGALDEAISSLEEAKRYFIMAVKLTDNYYKESGTMSDPEEETPEVPSKPTDAYPQK